MSTVSASPALDVAAEKLLELGDGGNTGAQRKVDQNHSPPDNLNIPTLVPSSPSCAFLKGNPSFFQHLHDSGREAANPPLS